MAKRRKRPIQLDLPDRRWGGRRPGAGRKRDPNRRTAHHRTRPSFSRHHPLHVTMRLVGGLPSLRLRETYPIVRAMLRAGANRFGVRLVHFSVMATHFHLIVEAPDRRALGRAMKGLAVRLARRLNVLWRRRGRVFADRYKARVLATPTQVRNALGYALNNSRRHAAQQGRKLAHNWIDPCSSGAWFDGWSGRPRAAPESPFPSARTWLLRTGWRRAGLIDVNEVPGGRVEATRSRPR